MADNKTQTEMGIQEDSELYIKKARESAIVTGIKKCGRLDGKTRSSFFLSFIKGLSIDRKFIKPLKYRIALAKDESMVFFILSYLGRLILSLEIATYGTFLLLFSITSFLTEGARALISTRDFYSIDYSVAIQSIILFILALLLIFGGRSKNLSEGILGSSILSFVFLKVLGVRKEAIQIADKKISGSYFAILFGVVFGLMTLVVSPMTVLCRGFLLILGITIVCVPESGVVMTFLALPFLEDSELFLMTLFVWICYILKLLLGKRSFKLTFTDGAVICFGLWTLLAGVVSLGGNVYEKGITGMWMVLCFVLVSTLIKNRRWIARCRTAVVLSAEIYGIISVFGTFIQYISKELSPEAAVTAYLPTDLPTVTRQTGLFLLLAIFFVFSSFKMNGEKKSGLRSFLMSTVLIAGIFLTFSWEIWIAFIFGSCFYFIYTRPKSIFFILLIAVVLVALFILLPDDIIEGVLEFSNFSMDEITLKLQNNKAILKTAWDNIFGGTGLSESALRAEMSKYLEEGYIASIDGTNTLLRLLAQLGLFGMFLFMFIFVLVAGSYSVWGRSYKADRGLASVGGSGFASFIAFLFLGMSEFIFSNPAVTMFFWLLAGLVYASCKAMMDEAYGFEIEDEAVYYVERSKSEVKADAE